MEPAIGNLLARVRGSATGATATTVTGLVVQGGGMRGTYSMAALAALEEAGLGGAFDHVIGSSAGAINGAYFLAGQARLAVTVYLDDISNKNFVNFLRLGRIVDIDFLVDYALTKVKPLNVAAVRASRSELHIVVTDFQTGRAAVFSNRRADFDFMEAIRATAALPILYNKVVDVAGSGYVDGGVVESVPLQRAVALGCTDILVVLTRTPAFRRKRPNAFMRLIEEPFIREYPTDMREVVLREDDQFNEAMELLENPSRLPSQVRVAVVAPSDLRRMVGRTTSDRRKLLACALMARDDTRRALGLPPMSDDPFSG